MITIKSPNGDSVVDITSMILDQQLNYYEMTLYAQTDIIGIGERVQSSLFYPDGVYTMWNMDRGMPFENGKPPGTNTYGTHPFFMYQSSKDTWVGVFTKSAAAQDWYIKNDRYSNITNITFIAAGGLSDLYFIIDQTPNLVSAAYIDLVGKPVLIPYWTLGWH